MRSLCAKSLNEEGEMKRKREEKQEMQRNSLSIFFSPFICRAAHKIKCLINEVDVQVMYSIQMVSSYFEMVSYPKVSEFFSHLHFGTPASSQTNASFEMNIHLH